MMPTTSAGSSTQDLLLGVICTQLLTNMQQSQGLNIPRPATPPTLVQLHPPITEHLLPMLSFSLPASIDAPFNIYPEIEIFMQQLGDQQPQQAAALVKLGITLVEKNFYNIDKIQHFTMEKYVLEYKISESNAQFVVNSIGQEMKRIRRLGKN